MFDDASDETPLPSPDFLASFMSRQALIDAVSADTKATLASILGAEAACQEMALAA